MIDENIANIKKIFSSCSSPEEKYKKLIEIGQQAPPFPDKEKTEDNLVPGCQSILYVHAEQHDGRLSFYVWSDALISKGLAALGALFYSGLSPEEAVRAHSAIFQEIGITSSLSPSRVNGFANLLIKIKKKSALFIN